MREVQTQHRAGRYIPAPSAGKSPALMSKSETEVHHGRNQKCNSGAWVPIWNGRFRQGDASRQNDGVHQRSAVRRLGLAQENIR